MLLSECIMAARDPSAASARTADVMRTMSVRNWKVVVADMVSTHLAMHVAAVTLS